jgi:hypothetical protein
MFGGVALLDQVTDSSARIVRRGLIIAREANGLRVLQQLLLDARVTGDTLDRFRGDDRSAEFTSLCQHPGGWLESCRASVAVDLRRDTSVITAHLSTGETLELSRYAGSAELRYFDPLAADSTWAKRWSLSLTMPVAIGIVVGGDTVIHVLGVSRE